MRDFRVQEAVNCIIILQRGEMTLSELFQYIWLWIKPMRNTRLRANKMYDESDLTVMSERLLSMGRNDPLWFPRLFEPTTRGIRAWEYGILAEKIDFRGKSVLDVGCGNSRLPMNIAKWGARVTMVDMENPLEMTENRVGKNLSFVLGDMTKLAFPDLSFDVVVCISAIEHVDMREGEYFSEAEYERRAIVAVGEMVRVLKRGGYLYLTTDFYLHDQKTDRWEGSKEKIRGAFRWKMLCKFVTKLKREGIIFENEPEIEKEILVADRGRSNYRGRYFTTFAFCGKRN